MSADGEQKRVKARFSPNYRCTLMTVAHIQEVQRVAESNDLEYAFQTLRGQVVTFGKIASTSFGLSDLSGLWQLHHNDETCLFKYDKKDVDLEKINKSQYMVLMGLLVPRDDMENQPIVLEVQRIIPLSEFINGQNDEDRAKWFCDFAEKVVNDLMQKQ